MAAERHLCDLEAKGAVRCAHVGGRVIAAGDRGGGLSEDNLIMSLKGVVLRVFKTPLRGQRGRCQVGLRAPVCRRKGLRLRHTARQTRG